MVKSVKCGVKGCLEGEPDSEGNPMPFYTDPDCASVAERNEEMKQHVYASHTCEVDWTKADASKIGAEEATLTAEAEKLRAEALKKSR